MIKTILLSSLTALTLSAGPAMAQYEGFTPQYDTSGRSDMVSMPMCDRVYLNGSMAPEMDCMAPNGGGYSTIGAYRRQMMGR